MFSIVDTFQTKLAKNLTIHKKRVHDKIREEICHVCGKAFFDKVFCLAARAARAPRARAAPAARPAGGRRAAAARAAGATRGAR